MRLFIAPRHVERLQEIRAELAVFPLRVALASEALQGRDADADCILLDTTGELQQWYGIATVVFVGKSLTAHGAKSRRTNLGGNRACWPAHGEFAISPRG